MSNPTKNPTGTFKKKLPKKKVDSEFKHGKNTENQLEKNDEVNVEADSNRNIEGKMERLNLKHNIKDDNISKQLPVCNKPSIEAETATKPKNNATPVLMVHSKHDKRIQSVCEMGDINFNNHINNILKNMSVKSPMPLQTVSWFAILRGYSLFMVSPISSGKTLGYLPAVCTLLSNSVSITSDIGGPVCIIVCGTAQSVTNVEKMAKMFLKTEVRVLACYAGVDDLHITTTLLNGCDLLIATPSSLLRLLQATNFVVNLRRLSTFVLDDCERLSEVYANEIKFFTHCIKKMLERRESKELKVQYILASRIWCDFMEPLAKWAPDTVICIGAVEECVLYSKMNIPVAIVKKENKVDFVFEFLKDINASKRTIIVCDSNDEVALLEKALKTSKHMVFSCNNNTTIQDLNNLRVAWADYTEPLLGPILVCCDSNLINMNITAAHNLIQYSMPPLFSTFCKRFSVLNDNYPSIFKTDDENVKIKIILDEESKMAQLPKVSKFIKRCTAYFPSVLDEISLSVLEENEVIKAKKLYPLCDMLLTLGYCPDFDDCQERHTILKDYDAPKEWLPKEGTVKFKVLHVHSATLYSARIVSCLINGRTVKYSDTYSNLPYEMTMYYNKEYNKILHEIPEIGDICATSILHCYVRCQVVKILNRYETGTPNMVLVKLIDEERLEVTRNVCLYKLPDELKRIESWVVQVRLANVKPRDKDITFSELARDRIKKIVDSDTRLFVRGKISLTLGNCIFVNTLEVCCDWHSHNTVIVTYNLKKSLLENDVTSNPKHLSKLEKLCTESGLIVKEDEI